mmetsp:Transcript_7966/g.17830  ORF Transcript_7966/g.17830 Transcript_7966/m.17830 type:complete len:248 (+) Transcript_7966:578-1321(+)
MEGSVDLHIPVGDGDDNAPEGFHVVQQDAYVEVVVSVVAASIVAALRKQAFCLVKHQHGVLRLGLSKDGLDVLCGLADILIYQLSAVDNEERTPYVEADCLGSHCLARARRPVEQGTDPLCAAVLLLEPPLPKENGLRLRVVYDLLELVFELRRQDDTLQTLLRHNPSIEVRHGQPAPQLVRRPGVQIRLRHSGSGSLPGHGEGESRDPRVLDEATRQLVLAGQGHVVDVVGESQLWRRHRAPDPLP